ncbi:hypothetical protein AB0C97_26985 [Streptomyces goshikiensis]|uniref:hypothetical protein n=1 Tax=Streptomyces goshikiensis TaxID=1942 RepID=UPI0033CE27C7
MTSTVILPVLYDFVIHDVAGNIVAGALLIAATTAWRRIRNRRQTQVSQEESG